MARTTITGRHGVSIASFVNSRFHGSANSGAAVIWCAILTIDMAFNAVTRHRISEKSPVVFDSDWQKWRAIIDVTVYITMPVTQF